jgi:hypothetical protein
VNPHTRVPARLLSTCSTCAMAHMFISVFLDTDSLLHSLFLAFCETGAAKTVYIGRAVCKAWNLRVKDLTEQEMSALYSAACGDTIMGAFMSRLPDLVLPTNAAGVKMEEVKVLPHAAPSTEVVLYAAITGDREQIDPSLWVLLNRLASIALAAACKPPRGKSFACDFTMDLRGYSYYIVFEEKRKSEKTTDRNCEELLHAWWRAALETIMQRVQAQGSVSEADARASLTSFVDKMDSIPFHACRARNQTSFRSEGRQLLDAWVWP